VEPDYPEDVKATHISGQALIRFVIDKQGNAMDVRPLREAPTNTENREILDAMVKAVRQWKFKPYMNGSEPVEVETLMLLKFDFGAPQAPPARVRISMGVFHSNLIRAVEPDYPLQAKKTTLKATLSFT
jgi:TonB family protein